MHLLLRVAAAGTLSGFLAIATGAAEKAAGEPQPAKPLAKPQDSVIKPPFGLAWGESAERLERLLGGAKARIVERVPKGENELWLVEGLTQPNLRGTVFEFAQGKLISLSLLYRDESWSLDKNQDFYREVKTRIDNRYGASLAESPKESVTLDKPFPSATSTLQDTAWSRPTASIRLVLLEDAKDDSKTWTLRVIYAGVP